MRELKGIDVFGGNRHADGTADLPININWRDVKNAGIKFAILRITEKYGTDQRFKRNANRCEARGIPYGVYRYSYALTISEAVKEAKDVVKLLKGRKPSLPVFYDLEWDDVQRKQLTPAQIEAVTLAFFDVIVKAGYKVGIYCNVDWYRNVLTSKLKDYPLWLASYPDKNSDHGQVEERLRPKYPNVVCWQYSSHGTVPGIDRDTDMDLWYVQDQEDPDEPEDKAEEGKVSARDVISIMRSWLGRSEANGTHKAIIDLYNSHKPLARGYALSYSDSWCDATVSAVFIILNAVDLIGGTECGVDAHIQLFKAAGIWIEDGSIVPAPGDIITFNWDQSSQPNNGFADHIGIVEFVEGNVIHTIEGNASGAVRQRTYKVGDGNIRGFARPKYGAVDVTETPVASSGSSSGAPSKERKFVGRVTSESLAVRTWAGSEFDTIKSHPLLARGNLVDVCDEVDGWYYCLVEGKYYGFCQKDCIERA